MFACLYYRNEAGILTARKDLDYIGLEELLEALKRVGWKPKINPFSHTHAQYVLEGFSYHFHLSCSKRAHLKQFKKIIGNSPRN